MVSGNNEQHSQRHSNADQDLCQIKQVAERQHQRKKKSCWKRKKKTEFGGGCHGESNALE